MLPERKPLSAASFMVIVIVALIGFFPHVALVTGFATGFPLIGAKIAGAYVVVLASSSMFGYIFHEKRPRREVLFNLLVGAVSMYFIFQAVIFVSFFKALGKKDNWYKVSRKAD
ncbi:MAG: Glycosyl transferase family 2 [Thermotogales bacterium 46_20]|nr:MAG: Glycosyl transferase family 2 [Thermotogales bacterium 46_20]